MKKNQAGTFGFYDSTKSRVAALSALRIQPEEVIFIFPHIIPPYPPLLAYSYPPHPPFLGGFLVSDILKMIQGGILGKGPCPATTTTSRRALRIFCVSKDFINFHKFFHLKTDPGEDVF